MRNCLAGGVVLAAAVVLAGAPALAADVVVKAPSTVPASVFSWTGFYVGGNFGYHWDTNNDPASILSTTYYGATNAALVNSNLPSQLDPKGLVGGAQIGYNYQISSVVIGVEADADFLNGSQSRSVTSLYHGAAPPFVFTLSDAAKENWLSTVRARAGLSLENTLLYLTGGVAFSHVSSTHGFVDFATPYTAVNAASDRVGWVFGGGIENAISNNWTWRLEYLFADFGTKTVTLAQVGAAAPGSSIFSYPDRLTESVVRAGLNYKF